MEKIESISIDIETYSDRDLKKCGVYKYAESPNAELLLFGYSINNGPVTVIDVAQGEEVPEYILKALTDDNIIKWAYNASFERIFLSVWLKRNYPQYFEKGTHLPDVFCTNAPTRDERLIDALFRMKEGCRIAPETGYYFMDTVEEDDAGCDAVWLLSGINPLDSVYAVINPEDME